METEWVHWNPGASMPLRVRVDVECNTTTEAILANIQHNSAARGGWQKLEMAHDRTAILCGSGPSLADTLDDIRALEGDVFAMNGAAAYLDRNGILPDFQVIMDARPETATLIGPAKQHLFASQVDPECFRIVPDAKLWHATHGEIAPEFPEYQADYCMVGGAVSVGNASLVLAYVMGYRKIHCFGFDSSHRGEAGHAFAQPLNDGDPTTVVEFGRKEYIASFTMRVQAQYFMERAYALQREGCHIEVHGSGLLPDMYAVGKTEKSKYAALWDRPEYRQVAPGEGCVSQFLQLIKGGTVLDFGCGTGRASRKIAESGYHVWMYDFALNCLDAEVREAMDSAHLSERMHFIEQDLLDPIIHVPQVEPCWGFCTDVMEHVEPECVETVIRNVMATVDACFFQISLIHDSMGVLIGHPLHLSVFPAAWWRETFERLGYPVRWEESNTETACFFVHSTP